MQASDRYRVGQGTERSSSRVNELTMRTDEVDLPSGEVLRVSDVERPRGGRCVVMERMPGSHRARSLLEPGTGERLVVSAAVLPKLIELLEEVGE